jgi:hypothetical protein
VDLVRCWCRRKGLDKPAAVIASAHNEFGIKPDQVRIVVQITGRQIVDIVFFDDASKEVDSLVERIEGIRGI